MKSAGGSKGEEHYNAFAQKEKGKGTMRYTEINDKLGRRIIAEIGGTPIRAQGASCDGSNSLAAAPFCMGGRGDGKEISVNHRWKEISEESDKSEITPVDFLAAVKAKGLEYQKLARQCEQRGSVDLAAALETAGYVLFAGAVEEEQRIAQR